MLIIALSLNSKLRLVVFLLVFAFVSVLTLIIITAPNLKFNALKLSASLID